MLPKVEPVDGPELDRLITALLNVTGAVFQVIEGEREDPDADGLEIIDHSALRLRASLAVFAEHYEDAELEVITEFLALASVLIAQDGGFDDVFREAA